MKRTATLARAVDAAIRAENARFLADPAAIRAARREGDIYRLRLELDGTMLPLDPSQTDDARRLELAALEGIAE